MTPARPLHARVAGVGLLVGLLLRLLHLRYAVNGPLTWQPGPDEAYYLAFGRDVAHGSGGLTELFAFMDPLYGYVVGAILALGGSLFGLYVLQIAADVFTAWALYRIGARLDRPMAGAVATCLYAVTGTAIAYTAAIIKPTLDVAFMTGWMLLALRALDDGAGRRWAVLGLWTGLGIALRANFLLIAPCAAALAFLGATDRNAVARRISAFAFALALPLALLGARNHAISGTWSPMPNNGGIVLHQLYNAENPASMAGVPSFVGRYSTPFDIWSGYAAEAERRAGRDLAAHEISAHWGREARAYLLAHPGQTLANAVRKLRIFTAYPEVPNTRNYADERVASPVLHWLPPPFGLLFALGVPGLLAWARHDRRALVLLAPVATGVATIAIFFAEDRFRFDILTPFVLGAGFWTVWLVDRIRARRLRPAAAGVLVSILLGAWSISQARLLPVFPVDWQRLAWGYIKSGQRERAARMLEASVAEGGSPVGVEEIHGYLAVADRRWPDAVLHLERAVSDRQDRHEVWHNLSVALEETGRTEDALAAAARAQALEPANVEYRARVEHLLSRVQEQR